MGDREMSARIIRFPDRACKRTATQASPEPERARSFSDFARKIIADSNAGLVSATAAVELINKWIWWDGFNGRNRD